MRGKKMPNTGSSTVSGPDPEHRVMAETSRATEHISSYSFVGESNFWHPSLEKLRILHIFKVVGFNIRVYGLLVHNRAVLVSDEYIRGRRITKFPGGGLEFGEGTRQCVQREFMEELGMEVDVGEHFYTTDFFVPSAFDPKNQVLSIYYKVKPIGGMNFVTSREPHRYIPSEGAQSLRWIPLSELKPGDMSLVIDQKVAELLALEYRH